MAKLDDTEDEAQHDADVAYAARGDAAAQGLDDDAVLVVDECRGIGIGVAAQGSEREAAGYLCFALRGQIRELRPRRF